MNCSWKVVEVMCEVSSTYNKYVSIKNGKKVLYLSLKKASYGCMQLAILWYNTFKGCLECIGFKMNNYDPCVADKEINGKQCTICWYVDDMKVSHIDSGVVDKIIRTIEDKFGKMTVTRGKVHKFVWMDITFREDKTVNILMVDYLD